MERNVKDKTVIVTGGAQGLGLSIAEKFLENDAKVVIILDVDQELGAKAVDELKKKFGESKAVFIKCDVVADLDKVTSEIFTQYKTIDILVNNAGLAREESIKDTINVNVLALIEWSMKFYEFMRKDRGGNGGTILNVASIYGFVIDPYLPVYTASKHAVMGFTKSKGHIHNYEKSGVRMVAICPGYTRTALVRPMQKREDDFGRYLETVEWQDPVSVGEAAVEIFRRADSGTAWVIAGGKPVVQAPEYNF